MSRPLALAAALLASSALAEGGFSTFGPPRWANGVSSVHNHPTVVALPFAQFLQASAVPAAPNFCTAVAAHNTGNWACMDAAGTTTGLPISVVSAPSATTRRACPSGASCDAVPAMTFNGSANYLRTTSNTTSPTGNFTTCALYEVVNASGRTFIGKWSTNSFMFWLNSNPILTTHDGTAQTDAAGGDTPVAGLRYFHCATFQAGGGATDSTARHYQNGVAVGTPVTNMRKPQAATGAQIGFGASNTGAFLTSAHVQGLYLTDKLLSAAEILALNNSLNSYPTISGAAPIFTSTATQTCVASDGTSVTVPKSVPCLSKVQNVSGELPGYEVGANGSLSFANPIPDTSSKWCVSVTLERAGHWNFTANSLLFSMGTKDAANSMKLVTDANRTIQLTIRDAANTAMTATMDDWQIFSGPRQVGLCITPGSDLEMWADGREHTYTVGTGAVANTQWDTVPTTFYVGQLSDAGSKFPTIGRLTDFCFSTSMSACQDTTPPTRTGATRSIAWLGDSLTQGFGVNPAPPERLETLQGGTNYAWNYGTGGMTAAKMVDVWRNEIKGRGYTHLVVLGGVNDIRADSSAVTVEGHLQTIYDEARTEGLVLTPVTIAPWKNYAGSPAWSAGRQTVTEAVNTWILAYCTANALTCADAYDALNDTDPAVLAAANDSGDHLHLSQTGSNLLASTVHSAIP